MKKTLLATVLFMSSASIAQSIEPIIQDYSPEDSVVVFESLTESFDIKKTQPQPPTPPSPQPPPTPEPSPHPRVPSACLKVNLTEDQKKQIMDAVYVYKRSKFQLDSDLKVSHLDYVKNLLDAAGTKENANAISTKLAASVTSLTNAKLDFNKKIYFDILSAEQRPNAFICEHAMKRRMTGRPSHPGHGQRGDHHRQPEHGHHSLL